MIFFVDVFVEFFVCVEYLKGWFVRGQVFVYFLSLFEVFESKFVYLYFFIFNLEMCENIGNLGRVLYM